MNKREKHYSPEPDDTITSDVVVGNEDEDDCDDDAESPLTMVANKSLDLSRSLTDQCNRLADLTCNDYLWIDDTDVADEIISNSFSTKLSQESASSSDAGTLLSASCSRQKQSTTTTTTAMSSSTKSPSTTSTTSPSSTSATSSSTQIKKTQAVMEIYETEKKYCSSLWVLLDHFAGSLRRSRLVSNDVVSLMFSPCLEEIYKHHCQFLHQLDIQLINWNPQDTTNDNRVIDIFREFFKSSDCPLLRQYQSYVTGFSASLLKIRKVIKENDDVATLFKVLQGDACCDRLELNAFLLTPVQRIPRYVLLFKQLLKYTDQRSEEWTLISTCLADLANFLNCLNDSIEQSLKLVSIKTSMKPKKKFGISLKSNAQQLNGEKMFRQLSTGHQRNNLQYEQPQHHTLPSSSNILKVTPLRSKMKLSRHSKRESKAYVNMGLVDEDALNGTLVRSELETEASSSEAGGGVVVEPSTQTIQLFQNIIRFSSDDEDQLKRRSLCSTDEYLQQQRNLQRHLHQQPSQQQHQQQQNLQQCQQQLQQPNPQQSSHQQQNCQQKQQQQLQPQNTQDLQQILHKSQTNNSQPNIEQCNVSRIYEKSDLVLQNVASCDKRPATAAVGRTDTFNNSTSANNSIRFSTTFSKFENKFTSLAARRKKKSNKTGPLVASHNITGFTGIKDENSDVKFDEVVVENLDEVDGGVRDVELRRERKEGCQKTSELSANSTAKPENGAVVRKNSSIGGRILKKFKPSFEKENSTLQPCENEQQSQPQLQQAASATLFASTHPDSNASILSRESLKRKSIRESVRSIFQFRPNSLKKQTSSKSCKL